MGSSTPQPLVLKGMVLGKQSKVLEVQAKRRWQGTRRKQRVTGGINGGHVSRCKRASRISMKRRARVRLQRSRRPGNGIERRVRTLKKLVPNTESTTGLDGLFRETADYILSLQMRVKVMLSMVKALSGSDDQ